MGETDVFFERLAPEKNEKYSSKNYNFLALLPGEGTLNQSLVDPVLLL